MEKYFELKDTLEEKGYCNVEMIAGGLLIIAKDLSGKVCLFDLNANQVDLVKNNITIEKDPQKDGRLRITINYYQTKYE